MIIASHPKLGLIADSSTKQVHLSLGATARVDFAVPPAMRFVQEFCGKANTSSVGLVGRALTATGVGLEGYEIRITWATDERFLKAQAETGSNGIYVICNLPEGREFTVLLQKGEQVLAKAYVRLGPSQYKWLDLSVPPS